MLTSIFFCILNLQMDHKSPRRKPKGKTTKNPDVHSITKLPLPEPTTIPLDFRSYQLITLPPPAKIVLSEIEPGLFLGDFVLPYSEPSLARNNIRSVLTVMSDWARRPVFIEENCHLRIPARDSPTQDLLAHMQDACDFIEKSIALGGVFVHCWHGISRSTTLVIAYLMRRRRQSLGKVLAYVKSKRRVQPNANFLAQLRSWGEMKYEVWQDKTTKVPKEAYANMIRRKTLNDCCFKWEKVTGGNTE